MKGRVTLATLLAVALAAASTPAWAGPVEGSWTLDMSGGGDRARLNLRRSWSSIGSRGRWSHTDDVSRRELRGLPATGRAPDGPISLALVRDAGTIHLEGRLDRGHGEGHFTFAPDAGFVAELRRAGFQDASDEDLIRLCIQDLDHTWIKDMGSVGLRGATLSDLLRLHNNGVEASYVSALAPYFDAEDLVRLHNNGVEVSYVRGFRALGYQSATANDFIRLRNNDVSPAFARRARELHGPVSTEDLIKLRVNGAE